MTKIDVTQINGYAEMSDADKIKALEGFEYNDNSAELEKLKGLNSKANSEAKEWKDKYNSTLSDAEKKKNEESKKISDMETELAELRKEKTISSHKAELIGLGYSAELAEATAKAYVKNDMATVFANQKAFQAEHDKAYKAELLMGTSMPSGGGSAANVDYAKKAQEAQAMGNYTEAAYYTRLSQQAESN